MKTNCKRIFTIILLISITFNLPACTHKPDDTPEIQESDNAALEEKDDDNTPQVADDIDNQTENETASTCQFGFDPARTFMENIDILNQAIESQYGKQFSLSTIEDYEKSGQADWTLFLDDNEEMVGIDIATWKYDYHPDSDDSKYMDAVLTTFMFFYGEEMGTALWRLTGDLNDGGADESLYGFTHNGSQAVYRDGNTASYQPGSFDNFYLWLTPSDL